jgi:hypothetical protein
LFVESIKNLTGLKAGVKLWGCAIVVCAITILKF